MTPNHFLWIKKCFNAIALLICLYDNYTLIAKYVLYIYKYYIYKVDRVSNKLYIVCAHSAFHFLFSKLMLSTIYTMFYWR